MFQQELQMQDIKSVLHETKIRTQSMQMDRRRAPFKVNFPVQANRASESKYYSVALAGDI